MKTALYFDEQDAQVAFTAETEWEKTVLKMLRERLPDIAFEGGFYECTGGWIRHNYYSVSGPLSDHNYAGNSLMIRLPKPKTPDNVV